MAKKKKKKKLALGEELCRTIQYESHPRTFSGHKFPMKRRLCWRGGTRGIVSNEDTTTNAKTNPRHYTGSKRTKKRQVGGSAAGRFVRTKWLREGAEKSPKYTAMLKRRKDARLAAGPAKSKASKPKTIASGKKKSGWVKVLKAQAYTKDGSRLRGPCRKNTKTKKYECKAAAAKKLGY